MNFDWIYLNPFHYPGFSGSLYAIKDFDELHPVVRGNSALPSDRLVAEFVERANAGGVRVMTDLVINHTSKDALLTDRHPEWYVREEDGGLRSPRSEEHTSELQSLMRSSYAVFCLKKKTKQT